MVYRWKYPNSTPLNIGFCIVQIKKKQTKKTTTTTTIPHYCNNSKKIQLYKMVDRANP